MVYPESFIAPAHWATALLYGDYTPIDDDAETERIQAYEIGCDIAAGVDADRAFDLALNGYS